jgi:hypothetical protein
VFPVVPSSPITCEELSLQEKNKNEDNIVTIINIKNFDAAVLFIIFSLIIFKCVCFSKREYQKIGFDEDFSKYCTVINNP